MQLSQAKYFIYRDCQTDKLYKSKDFYKLLEMLYHPRLVSSSVWAVIPTQEGDQLFEMDMSYSHEPLIFGRYMHIDSFKGFYCSDIKDID